MTAASAIREAPADALLRADPILRAGRRDTFADVMERLRRLDLDHPRVYAIADMAGQGRRRWWALGGARASERIEAMVDRAEEDHPDRRVATVQVAGACVHAIVGRVATAVVLDGVAWDPGVDSLWMHFDSDVAIDWVGVADPTLRVVTGSRYAASAGRFSSMDGESLAGRRLGAEALHAGRLGAEGRRVVELPCERALMLWTAQRCLTSLSSAFASLPGVDPARFWSIVGESVVGTACLAPILADRDRDLAWRRGQGLLDAFVELGAPVRGRATSGVDKVGKPRLICKQTTFRIGTF